MIQTTLVWKRLIDKAQKVHLVHLVKNILLNLDKKKDSVAIFVDMSKAFDFVPHSLLLDKLENYGIRGPALEWIKSYLSDREQCVEVSKLTENYEIHHDRSTFLENKCGVPQGSIVGPKLFVSLINDLPDITEHKCTLFADDISILMTCDKKDDNFDNEINNTIKSIVEWLDNNNLNVNLTKTNYVQFLTHGTKPVSRHLLYENIELKEANYVKFLGITLDQYIDWKEQIKIVCTKVNRFVHVLNKLRRTSAQQTVLLAYHGYVSSVLRYGLLLWGNSTNIKKAFLSQKKCIRAMVGIRPHESCKPFFKKLGILTLTSMYIFEISMFVRKQSNIFQKASDKYPRVAKYDKRLVFERPPRLALFDKNCYAMCITVYNKLPVSLKELPYGQFRKKLKMWLLEKCFYCLDEFLNKHNVLYLC